MKTRLLAMTASAVVILTIALLWLMDGKVQDERRQALESGLRGPVNALSQTLLAEIRGLRRALPVLASSPKERIDWESLKPFYAVARIHRGAGGLAQVSQLATGDLPAVSSWTPESVAKLVDAVKGPAGNGVAMGIVRDGPERRKVLAVVLKDDGGEWAAFAGPESLDAVLDQQKSPKGWLAIVNGAGQILAHSTPEYAGTTVAEGSLPDQVRKSAAARGFESFSPADADPAMAAFEKPARTDLVIVAARPIAEDVAERRKTIFFGVLAGGGILLLIMSLMWTALSRWEAEEERLRQSALRAAALKVEAPSPAKPAMPKPAAAAKAGALPKVEVIDVAAEHVAPGPRPAAQKDQFGRIASALAYELRSPLLSILGYAQTVIAAAQQDERVTAPAESILRETRAVRDVVDKLLAYSGEAPGEKKPARLETALAKVLKEFEPKFQQRHVKVTKDLRETGAIPMVPDAFEKALRHVLSNAIEAMERMAKKEIAISLTEDPREIRLSIKDGGEGMSKENLARATDPFFTTRNPTQHLGMGLPAAFGLVREHGGELKLDSEPGKGTTVTFILPKTQKTVEIEGRKVELKTEEVVDVPKTLPAAKEAPAPKPASPADVDIDRLLAIPSELPTDLSTLSPSTGGEDAAETGAAVPDDELLDLGGGFEIKAPPAAPPAPARAIDDDKTPVTQTQADDRTVVLPQEAGGPGAAGGLGATAKPGGIEPPKFAAPATRASKLDSFRVEIRRPGARP